MEEIKPLSQTIKEAVAEAIVKVEEEKQEAKTKKFSPWIPWSAKVGKRKAKKNYILVDRWHENMTRDYERHQIKDGTILVDGIPRIVTPGDITLYKGKTPMVTIADWSTVPVNPKANYDQIIANGYGTKGWKLIYQRMKTAAIEDKKKISGMVIWIILGAIAVVGYFAFKGGLF